MDGHGNILEQKFGSTTERNFGKDQHEIDALEKFG
jgi:hypothetical protein